MMLYRNVLNFLRGSVQVEIECACPERVLNLCAVEEIAFWDLQWLSPIALRLRVTRRGWRALREVCTRADAQASRLRERGAPQLLLRLRTRYALLAALALLFALVLLYLLAGRLAWRKAGFYGTLAMLLVFVASTSFAVTERRELLDSTEAVVMSSSVSVKSSPDKASTDLFVLHEGTKVRTVSELGDWREIVIADGKKGWVEARTIETI